MIRAFQMIFAPEGAWQRIAEANRNFFFVLLLSTLPLLAASLAVEGAGIVRLGERTTEFGRVNVPQQRVIRYGVAHLALSIAFLLGAASMLRSICHSFHTNVTYSQAFNTLAYGASPIFLMRAVDGLPAINTWVCWGIGVALSIRAFYHGVAISLKPEQTKGFGLYVVTIIVVLFMSALPHFIAIAVLHDKILR